MPELYVALTDLLATDGEDLPRLPVAERLLSRAMVRPAAADWRRWVLELAGLEPPAGDLPVARTLAAAHGIEVGGDATWFVATPVHLAAGLTRVHFAAEGGLNLDADAAARLARRFASDWADPALAMHVAGGTLLLRASGAFAVATHDPSTYAGRQIHEALPAGPDAGRLERLMTELQMWLHGVGIHAEGLVVNGLWLWGAGRSPLAGTPCWPRSEGADAFLDAAAGALAGPTSAASLESWSVATFVRKKRPFAALDTVYFERLAALLRDGTVDAARVHVAGREFVLARAQRWRRWVRVRPWWELLA
ncbi:MAG TPA: hypothetical protein VMT92_04565 [Steroidobacteraceae bacterium]|nr:hypothetical protein [Steroidobacteraceae bacterium]